jgi:hypothetical protein
MPPQINGPLKHVARYSPQVGKIASYFEGTATLTGRVERADAHTYGQIKVFIPDAKSNGCYPNPGRAGSFGSQTSKGPGMHSERRRSISATIAGQRLRRSQFPG